MVSQTVYFTGMMVFTLTSQIISVLVPVLVRVPEYLFTSTSTITLELTSMSTVRVPEIQYSSTASTSTPALGRIAVAWHYPGYPSICLSVTPVSQCSCHCIIMKCSRVIPNDKSDVNAKCQGQRSWSQRSKPNLTVSWPWTSVWIHTWQWNDAQSLM